jgi:hypothetical protein
VEMGAEVDVEEPWDSVMLGNGSSGPGNGQRRPAPMRSSQWKKAAVEGSWGAPEEWPCFRNGILGGSSIFAA